MLHHYAITTWTWVGFLIFVVIMLALDLGVFHKKSHIIKIKEALIWSAVWIGLALIFNVGIYFFIDEGKAVEFFTAYVVEKSLSVDNLFVFVMLFTYFKIDEKYQHKVLFWGILGALIMRAIFIFAGIALINTFHWVIYIFGVFLLFTGFKMFFQKEHAPHPERNPLVKIFKKIFPVTDYMQDGKFFIKINNRTFATPLFVVLLVVEFTDLIFAVDSIPAVLAISKDSFIVFTSNVFAILGLRALYFALAGIMQYFYYLKYGLSVILAFIGTKMILNEIYDHLIHNLVSLFVILGILSISIIISLLFPKKKDIAI